MARFIQFVSIAVLFGALQQGWAAAPQSDVAAPVMLPAGTKLELAVTVPIWAKTAKPGDPLYAQTNFPVTSASGIAIPAGTYVEGRLESVTRPTRKLSRAELRVLFTKIIFANGYTIALLDVPIAADKPTQDAQPGGATSSAAADSGPSASLTAITIEVSTANDLLLDNGAQIEMTLVAPLELDAGKIAKAIPLSRAPEPGSFKSATLCRPTPGSPGSPGTSDTVIPGSPGTPGTTVPGGPGMPDITIPGTPPTPPTVISGTPGTPGTPGTVCPLAPIVISSLPSILKPSPSEGQQSPTPR